MKSKQLFWGLLFFTLGILFLLNNVIGTHIELGSLYRFWPVILILIGFSVIVKQDMVKVIMSALTGILLALIIFSFFNKDWLVCNSNWNKDKNIVLADTVKEPWNDSIKQVNISFDGGAASFSIDDKTGNLFTAASDKIASYENFSVVRENDIAKLKIKMKEWHVGFGEKHANHLSLSLNPKPIYNLIFDVGAASADFDLTGLKVKNLDVNIGAASLVLKLSNPVDDTLYADIDAGASSINISIPKTVGAEIYSDLALSSKHISGFKEIRDDRFQTEEFDKAKKKIIFRISGGVSSFTIDRY